MADVDIKRYAAEICRICEKLYPDEWPGKYTGSRADFRNWIMKKTGVTSDHRDYNKCEFALKSWATKLKIMESELSKESENLNPEAESIQPALDESVL